VQQLRTFSLDSGAWGQGGYPGDKAYGQASRKLIPKPTVN